MVGDMGPLSLAPVGLLHIQHWLLSLSMRVGSSVLARLGVRLWAGHRVPAVGVPQVAQGFTGGLRLGRASVAGTCTHTRFRCHAERD